MALPLIQRNISIILYSVVVPYIFLSDPDPRIRNPELWIGEENYFRIRPDPEPIGTYLDIYKLLKNMLLNTVGKGSK